MLSRQSLDSFDALSRVVEAHALSHFEKAAGIKANQLLRGGLFQSGAHIRGLDELACEGLKALAEQLYDALVEAHSAEPVANSVARTDQLQALFDEQLTLLSDQLLAVRDKRIAPLWKGNTLPLELPEYPKLLELIKLKYRARIQLKVIGLANHQRGQETVKNTFNVAGSVGSIQTGAHSRADVIQTITTPSSQEVTAALQVLAAAIASCQSLNDVMRIEAIEVLEELQAQADRESPNVLKIGSLMSGLATIVQTIPAAVPAWVTLQGWLRLLSGT